MERKFNLVLEPWIQVRRPDETVETVSLADLFANAQTYTELAGETAAQNAAVLRPLLGIVHKAILENDPDGDPDLLEEKDKCYDRWQEIWESGHLPQAPIQNYLKEHIDDFWLIDEKNPFMQSTLAKIGTVYGASKLLGNVAESSNKVRLFSSRALEGKESVSFAEAARWLLNLNGYDDTSAKAKNKEQSDGSPGAGWLGKLGQLYAKGENLFETLMLNCILIRDGKEVYPPDHLSWEDSQTRWKERHHVPQPGNFGELMTFRSRLILLESDGDCVTGYKLLGGEYFDRENCFAEPFTVWRAGKEVKDKPREFTPKRHSEARQLWRDFSSIVAPEQETGVARPGIVEWIQLLIKARALPSDYPIVLEAPFVSYGDKDFFITNVSSQNLTLLSGMFADAGTEWIKEIQKQIKTIDKIAACAGYFYADVAEVRGGKKETRETEKARGMSKAYALLDEPFSAWLSSIRPEENDEAAIEQKVGEWASQAALLLTRFRRKKIEKSINMADPGAVFGRMIKDPESGQDKSISILQADQKFAAQIRKYYPSADLFTRDKEEVIPNVEQA
ncbi:type I-E CRISPR-associated protein Cse1/CasA [Allobaculum mucilyticum]|uniref:type I-E CRISPR-associated protein Cse1/CasA n=1 Tax=Allobaculum mucilyticum TaxID=2834459 RepID=UPI001E367469|nr:type I-E CRISPR-associated protein Cse1/CasA [Allobaculum mucilyticum]UNT95277.1 type I-E CRISPR-associated protein Cse1/CasA [Allobaculum mucilyticum]